MRPEAMKESSRQTSSSPCAACKLLRRRCAKDCVFAPYFPADEPLKFASVHKVFGASNVNKMLQDLPEHQRGDAVSSMVYEANARVRDPVYGCVGAISSLQQQVAQLQTQLAVAQAEIVCLRMQQHPPHAHPHFLHISNSSSANGAAPTPMAVAATATMTAAASAAAARGAIASLPRPAPSPTTTPCIAPSPPDLKTQFYNNFMPQHRHHGAHSAHELNV